LPNLYFICALAENVCVINPLRKPAAMHGRARMSGLKEPHHVPNG
jgi:hypothetical protein